MRVCVSPTVCCVIEPCVPLSLSPSLPTTGIVLGVLSGLIVFSSVFVLTVLYRRGLAIRRKRAMRRYLESGEVSATVQR